MCRIGRVGVVFMSVLVVVCLGIPAAKAVPVADWAGETLDKCCFGGDIRIREVHFDDIPWNVPGDMGPARGGENHFFRFRTRLWGQYDPAETVTVKARLVNEFREIIDPDSDAWEFPDELVVDKLYIEIRDLMDQQLDIKIGRQDLIYGTGKLILEGTPLDGSRTIYMDAVKATWKGCENTTVDFLGIYNSAENDLVVSSEDRNLNGYHPADEQFDDMGGGVYVKNKSMEQMPLEAYYLYKNTEEFTTRNDVFVEEADIHTVGGRLLPKMNDQFSGAVEAAYQTGEQGDVDLEAVMVDATVNWHLPLLDAMKPTVSAGYYYLSGDDPDTTDENERWNPLWGRWPQYSELYIYAWDADGAGSWGNLSMPHVDLRFLPCKGAKALLMVAELTAPEEDGPGAGDGRGLLGVARLDFTLASGIFSEKDKLFGHLLLEYLDPDDYYELTEDAHFARWELSYAF